MFKFLSLGGPAFLLLSSLSLTLIFCSYMLHFSNSPSIKFISKQDSAPPTNSLHITTSNQSQPAGKFRIPISFLFPS
ncbi:hypothetical protein P3S67_025452 [Capsicum chacoense]